MLHHSLEEPQQPPTADDITACLERADRFAQQQRAARTDHARSLSPDELRQEIRVAGEMMHARIDAGHYLEAKERRNAAIQALSEWELPVRGRERDGGMEL